MGRDAKIMVCRLYYPVNIENSLGESIYKLGKIGDRSRNLDGDQDAKEKDLLHDSCINRCVQRN
jgi:hypothetical protein